MLDNLAPRNSAKVANRVDIKFDPLSVKILRGTPYTHTQCVRKVLAVASAVELVMGAKTTQRVRRSCIARMYLAPELALGSIPTTSMLISSKGRRLTGGGCIGARWRYVL